MAFLGQICFPSKVPEFLHVLFSLVEKISPVSFLGFNALGQLCCIHCALFDILSSVFSETKCKPAKKIQGECFTTSSKSTCKNSGTFEGKKFYPKKSLIRPSCTKPFNYPQKGMDFLQLNPEILYQTNTLNIRYHVRQRASL